MLALLLGLDPWLLLTVLFALLWVVEMRASRRVWLKGAERGYSMAPSHANEQDAVAAVDSVRQRIMDSARADLEPR